MKIENLEVIIIAAMASGFCGPGFSAPPVAIANMASVTSMYGPSP